MHFAFTSIALGVEAEEAAHTPLWKDYLWKIINFGILVFILYKFGKKPLQSFLRQRTELIEKTLKEAKEAKETAEKALCEVEEKLKTKDAEIEKILSASRQMGETERESLIEEGNKLREKILEQAKVNIDYELKHAREAIKAEAVEIALELAEKKLKEKLTKEEQEKLLEESIAKIGGSR
ncbi:MAG: F0F1 ATP synthase subunit B [Thermodesulfovibrionales bacterium]|nr:F0F1 ATP synthase subunit B [Thermodesulfovibrionales bacterium]